MCLVFDQLGMSLYDYLLKTRFASIPLPDIQTMGRQLLTSIACESLFKVFVSILVIDLSH